MIFQSKNIPALFSSRSYAIRIGLFVFVFAWAIGLLYFEPKEIPLVETIRVTIPEGFNVRQIAGTFEKLGMFPAEDFIEAARPEEGFLFPDTYEFYKVTTPERVIAKMKENFSQKITSEILIEIERQKKTLSDIIIMASLLEEEAAKPEDWKIISGILWKRLGAGIPLQVDAEPSTYDYLGFPAAPISNPGLEAIGAVLYPSPSPYLYYLSDKAGNLHYSRTFEEHVEKKLKYLR